EHDKRDSQAVELDAFSCRPDDHSEFNRDEPEQPCETEPKGTKEERCRRREKARGKTGREDHREENDDRGRFLIHAETSIPSFRQSPSAGNLQEFSVSGTPKSSDPSLLPEIPLP